jgi:hypothetical protein
MIQSPIHTRPEKLEHPYSISEELHSLANAVAKLEHELRMKDFKITQYEEETLILRNKLSILSASRPSAPLPSPRYDPPSTRYRPRPLLSNFIDVANIGSPECSPTSLAPPAPTARRNICSDLPSSAPPPGFY